jgi:hypothetical protein
VACDCVQLRLLGVWAVTSSVVVLAYDGDGDCVQLLLLELRVASMLVRACSAKVDGGGDC